MKRLAIAILVLAGCGAQTVKVEPVKVEPIHMTIDVNLHDSPAQNARKP
ncbi:MAG TPA: hypothetical protein VFQ53_33610 [Kofleriaceae bacterium]|nr:hypothetical protein [Kofleriaceae bacterium]